MRRPRQLLIVAAAAALALAVPQTGSAAGASPEPSDPIATGLIGPLQIDVGHRGQVYVAQAFAGILTKVRLNGTTKDLVFDDSVNGVASREYTVAYVGADPEAPVPYSFLKLRKPNGKVRMLADLRAFEEKYNPDSVNTYGFQGLSDECADQVPGPPDGPGGESYPGQIDSNAYAVAKGPNGSWYVADAGGNTILKVSRRGHVKVVAVLPPQPLVTTAEAAEASGFPECTVGATFAFEPVPTDVEVTKTGKLVISLLPGGPEDPSLGARGSVHRINPWTGAVTTLGTGFVSATNVAIGPHGKIYVAELFANQISVLKNGAVTPFVEVPLPGSVEFARGKLYASIDVFGNGSVVTVKP